MVIKETLDGLAPVGYDMCTRLHLVRDGESSIEVEWYDTYSSMLEARATVRGQVELAGGPEPLLLRVKGARIEVQQGYLPDDLDALTTTGVIAVYADAVRFPRRRAPGR